MNTYALQLCVKQAIFETNYMEGQTVAITKTVNNYNKKQSNICKVAATQKYLGEYVSCIKSQMKTRYKCKNYN